VCTREVDRDDETRQRVERRNAIKISSVKVSREVHLAYLRVTRRRTYSYISCQYVKWNGLRRESV